MPGQDLEALYIAARSALKKRDYERAGDLLTQVLLADENYKDASQLLARAVRLKKRRWYQRPLLWGAVGLPLFFAMLGYVAMRVGSYPLAKPPETEQAPATALASGIGQVDATPISEIAIRAGPLGWKRISIGQEFARNRVTAIVMDPRDPLVMYVGTESAGIYKTIDGGLSWGPSHAGLGRAVVDSLVIDPDNTRTLYAGTILGGVYKTTDGGRTWGPANNGIDIPGGPFLATVAMDPRDGDHLFYTDSLTLYETLDAGKSWRRLARPACPKVMSSLVMPAGASGALYVSDRERSPGECELAVYRSRDDGLTWDTIPLNIYRFLEFMSQSLTVSVKPVELIFITGQDMDGIRLYRIMEQGNQWKQVLDRGCYPLSIDPRQEGRLYCGGTQPLLFSDDWGDSWLQSSGSPPLTRVVRLPQRQDALTAAGAAGGLWISQDNGLSWAGRSEGLGGASLRIRVFPQAPQTLFAEGEQGIYQSNDQGVSWDLLVPQARDLAMDAGGGTLYALADRIITSEDYGRTWQPMTATRRAILSFIAHPLIPRMLIAIHEQGFSWSIDGGETWDETYNVAWRTERDEIFGMVHTQLVPDPSGILFYLIINGETQGRILRLDGVTRMWEACEMPGELRKINLLSVDPLQSGRIIISAPGKGLLSSVDGCKTWKYLNNGLQSFFVNSLSFDPGQPRTLYAGTDGGAYVSFDAGERWSQMNDGLLGATVVYSTQVGMGGQVYAMTPYGFFRLEGK